MVKMEIGFHRHGFALPRIRMCHKTIVIIRYSFPLPPNLFRIFERVALTEVQKCSGNPTPTSSTPRIPWYILWVDVNPVNRTSLGTYNPPVDVRTDCAGPSSIYLLHQWYRYRIHYRLYCTDASKATRALPEAHGWREYALPLIYNLAGTALANSVFSHTFSISLSIVY